jgi:hypothetical protein
MLLSLSQLFVVIHIELCMLNWFVYILQGFLLNSVEMGHLLGLTYNLQVICHPGNILEQDHSFGMGTYIIYTLLWNSGSIDPVFHSVQCYHYPEVILPLLPVWEQRDLCYYFLVTPQVSYWQHARGDVGTWGGGALVTRAVRSRKSLCPSHVAQVWSL